MKKLVIITFLAMIGICCSKNKDKYSCRFTEAQGVWSNAGCGEYTDQENAAWGSNVSGLVVKSSSCNKCEEIRQGL